MSIGWPHNADMWRVKLYNKRLNPTAVIFWAIGGLVGYLVNDSLGAIWGLVITLSISLIFSVID